MPDAEYEAELLFQALRLDSLSTGDLKQTGQMFVSTVQMHGALTAVRVSHLALQACAICQFINDALTQSSSSQELKLVIFQPVQTQNPDHPSPSSLHCFHKQHNINV
jgi:hypothetical protein